MKSSLTFTDESSCQYSTGEWIADCPSCYTAPSNLGLDHRTAHEPVFPDLRDSGVLRFGLGCKLLDS